MLQKATHRASFVLKGLLRGDGGCLNEGERRKDLRYVTTLRIGVLHTQLGKELCVVKNISAGGLSAQAYREFSVGEAVQIELTCEQRIDGVVQWVRENDIGVAFPELIDVEATLATPWVTENSQCRRLPRLEAQCTGRLRIGVRFYLAKLVNISQGGAMVETQRPVEGSGDAVLTLEDLGALEGTLRWCNETTAGISFNERIPFKALARWIQEHRKPLPDPDPQMMSALPAVVDLATPAAVAQIT